jgi:hypothetical protein
MMIVWIDGLEWLERVAESVSNGCLGVLVGYYMML